MSIHSDYASRFLEILKSYNINIDTESSGTYFDVTANAIGGSISQVYYYMQQVEQGNIPANASSYMLEEWASSLNLVDRKTGYYSSGIVTLTGATYPITVNKGSNFTVGTSTYVCDTTTVVVDSTTGVPITATAIGAEYNIKNGIVLISSDFGTYVATTGGTVGGSGQETDSQLLSRVLQAIAYVKTDAQLSDYVRKGLQYFNYVEVKQLFVEGVVCYGVGLALANTISDYEVASQLSTLVDIAPSTSQLEVLRLFLANDKSVGHIIELDTVSTQEVNNLTINVTANTVLEIDDLDEIKKQVRIALLRFTGDTLYQHNLLPAIDSIVTSYHLDCTLNIPRTSPLMDCLLSNIIVNQI